MDVKRNLVNEIHKPARRIFPRRKFVIKHKDDIWESDLVDMSAHSNDNNSYTFMLTVIDCFSKYAWAKPLKNKSAGEVTRAMREIFQSSKRSPNHMHTDNGKEFFNSSFKTLMNEYKINHYATFSTMKAAIVERFNRTLKEKMWREFSYTGSYKWLHILDKILFSYNNTKHRTINIEPSKVDSAVEQSLIEKQVFQINDYSSKRGKFKVNDYVRISLYKAVFTKGYLPNYSCEVFKIYKINKTTPTTYMLEDYQGKPISGAFYEHELIKTKYHDTYLIEKVLKRGTGKRKGYMFVKWLGFPDEHNSWTLIK